MRTMVSRILAVVVAMIPIAAMAQENEKIPGTDQIFGTWRSYAWKEGGRSGCSMSSNVFDGGGMGFIAEGERLSIIWWHPKWKITADQSVAVAFWVDQSSRRSIDTMVAPAAGGGAMLMGMLPDSPELLDQFRTGTVLHIRVAGGTTEDLLLTGLNVALANLQSCAAKYKGTVPPPSASALPKLTPAQHLEIVRLAANLLSRLPGFRILNEEEQKEIDPKLKALEAAVVWRSENAIGMLHLLPDVTEDSTPRFAAFMVAGMARLCKDKSDATNTPDVRSASVRRLHISCASDGGTGEARVVLMPFKGGVYFLMAAGESKDAAAVLRAEELLRNALFEVAPK